MKRIPLAILLCFTFLSLAQAEYPPYRWINPYQREITGSETVLSLKFDDPKLIAGRNQCELSFGSPDGLKVASQGVDPYFWTSDAGVTKVKPISERVRFHLTLNSELGPSQIFWNTDKRGGFDEERSVRFNVPKDGQTHKCSVDATIDGNLRQIRIDPGSGEGTATIKSLEIEQLFQSPLEITNMFSDKNKFEIEITNHSGKTIAVEIYSNKQDAAEKRTISPKQKITVSNPFPKKEPFEENYILIMLPDKGTVFTKSAYAFHEELLDRVPESKWTTIQSDQYECRFYGSLGAVIMKKGAKNKNENKALGVLCPLPCSDFDFPSAQKTSPLSFGPRLLNLVKSDSRSITFAPDRKRGPQLIEELTFSLEKNELSFKMKNTGLFGPVFRPLGTMEQAVLSGVEYLEKREHSSSTADLETPEHLRVAPKPLLLTLPFAGIITDRCSFGLLWDDPLNTRLGFATPDFLEGKQPGDPMSHRISVHGGNTQGVLRIGPGYGEPSDGTLLKTETIEDAILWAVKKRGEPNVPPVPRSREEQSKLNLAGFMDSELTAVKGNERGWYHAILPGGGHPFGLINGSDFVSTIWQITGEIPPGSRNYARGGGHLANPCIYFITGQAQRWLDEINGIAAGQRRAQKPDGSFRYSGKYLKGHWKDTASGYCGNVVVQLFDHYRYTGNEESLAAALKGTDYFNTLRTPRGAQTWELSLHTPDIMGSAWCCLANVRAFEATKKEEYLREAKRWAVSGIPFVYLWSAGKETPVMLYATTPVLGATNWVAPNWIGLPVQWCGLDYAEALFVLAPHDKTLDWAKIAEGILVAGEQMQYEKGPSIGLLPDSWVIAEQRPQAYDINPVVLERLRRRVEGKLPALDVQVSPSGKRVVAPFPIRFNADDTFKNENEYQVIVNGQVQ